LIQGNAGKGGGKFEFSKARGGGFGGATRVQPPRETAASVIRVDEERANARRLGFGIEPIVDAGLVLVAPEQRAPSAPSTSGDDRTVVLDHEVRSIREELRVHAENVNQGGFDYFGAVMSRAQPAHRITNQCAERW